MHEIKQGFFLPKFKNEKAEQELIRMCAKTKAFGSISLSVNESYYVFM